MTMQCLLKEVHQFFISSKKLPYQNTVALKYICIIEFVYKHESLLKTTLSLSC